MDGAAKSGPSTDVPRGSVPAESNPEGGPAPPESIDVEQFKREAVAFAQQMVDWVGRDTPEGKGMLRDLEREMVPIPRPTNAEPEQTQLIDLRLLEDSPLHHRTYPSSEEQTALERSIAANGLKNPIEVRPRVPFKWSKRRLQVDVDQVGALDASQKQQLRTVIQEILTKL